MILNSHAIVVFYVNFDILGPVGARSKVYVILPFNRMMLHYSFITDNEMMKLVCTVISAFTCCIFIVLQERTSEDSKESESFKELLTARTHEFIEEVLTPHFGGMIMFVKDSESIIERGNLDLLKNEDSKILFCFSSFIVLTYVSCAKFILSLVLLTSVLSLCLYDYNILIMWTYHCLSNK